MMNAVALPQPFDRSVRSGAPVTSKISRTRCVRRSHPVINRSSPRHTSSPTLVSTQHRSSTPAFATFITTRRRATTTAAAIGPAFELAARVKAPFSSSIPSEALVALLLATALIALLGRDENNLLLATITFRAMSVGSIVQWWLSPTGRAVAFGVLAIKTFLAGASVGIRVLTTSPYGAGAGRLDALLNAVTTLGLLIITGPKDVFTFARDSKFGAVLNAAICAYLLFANLLSGRKGGGDDGSRGGDSSGAGGGNYLLTTVAFAGLLLLATPGMMRALR